MGRRRWRPNSRRDRRRQGTPTQRQSQDADKAFLVIAGVFVLIVLALLAVLIFTSPLL